MPCTNAPSHYAKPIQNPMATPFRAERTEAASRNSPNRPNSISGSVAQSRGRIMRRLERSAEFGRKLPTPDSGD